MLLRANPNYSSRLDSYNYVFIQLLVNGREIPFILEAILNPEF